MFQSCTSLVSIPSLNLQSAVNNTSMFDRTLLLEQGVVLNNTRTISYAQHTGIIIDIFNALGTTVGATITITGNPGVADLTANDRKIATDKNWIIVG